MKQGKHIKREYEGNVPVKSFRNNFPTCGAIFLDNKSIHRVPFKNRKSKTLSSGSFFFFLLHSSVHESLGLPVSTRHFLFSLTDWVFCRRPAGTWQRTDLNKHCFLLPSMVFVFCSIEGHYPFEGALCTSKFFSSTTRA